MACGCSSGGGCSTKKTDSGGCCSPSEPLGRLPAWFRQPVPDVRALERMRRLVNSNGLETVCESAHCPNIGTCWGHGVATFMILGAHCSRACRFCAIPSGQMEDVFVEEPIMVAEAVRKLGLRYVVITSVTRDDLPDQGAGQFVRTVRAIRSMHPGCGVELLTPDFNGAPDLIAMVMETRPEVFGHNIETVRRLAPLVRPQADHDRSLNVLRLLRSTVVQGQYVKSSLMVGMGETDQEILQTLRELADAGCDIVTIGQYLAPTRTKRHVPVDQFVAPETFDMYRREGEAMGIRTVRAGALVRSSYLAEEGFRACEAKKETVCS